MVAMMMAMGCEYLVSQITTTFVTLAQPLFLSLGVRLETR